MAGGQTPKKRTTKTRRNNRRSHHALTAPVLQETADGKRLPRRLHKAASLGLTKYLKREI